MKKILIVFLVAVVFAACKTDELQQYSEKSRIYLSLRRDSVYSKFPLSTAGNIQIDYSPQKSTKKTDTLRLRLQTSGQATQTNRAFVLERNTAVGNAVEGVDFEILDKGFTIPAGKFNTVVRVVVKRNANMAKQAVSFGFNLKANENFELGPHRDTLGFTSLAAVMNMTAIRITAKDMVVKPANWDTFIAKYFGVYSEVKYRFVIDVLGITAIPSTTTASRMNTYRNTLKTALTKYNNENPQKLKDENGIDISF